MAAVVYSKGAMRDFERIVDFLREDNAPAKNDNVRPVAGNAAPEAGHAVSAADVVVAQIADAISVLARHPYIGRPAEHSLHELVISRGKTGYVALYRYLDEDEVVLILALRHQREAGHP